jgi:hypothetical protein
MAKKKLELQWTKLGEGVLADWRAAVDDKQGVRLEQASTGKNWGPWHLRNGETLVSADTMRAKPLVKEATRAADGCHKGVPMAALEALESFAAAWLKEPGRAVVSEKAPELRVLLPAFEQLATGEYVLDAPDSQLAAWKVLVVDLSPNEATLALVEPGLDKPITHGPYAFDTEGGTLMGVGTGCQCGRPDTSPGEDHHRVLEALALAEAALTADVEGAAPPVAHAHAAPQPTATPSEERPRIVGLPREQVTGDLLRRWLKVAHLVGEGGKLSEAVESLPVPLTPEGRLRKADLLAATHEEDTDLDVEEKAFKDDMKRRREDVDKRRQKLLGEIQSRKEYRDVRTVEVVVYPLRAVWRVRTDTYEVVDSRAMDLGDQAAHVYAEDDTSAPFSPRHRSEVDESEDGDDMPAESAPRPKKKRAPSSSNPLSLALTTEQALDLEPEEKRRKATPDSTSDMTVSAPVKHRCQRPRCGHSEADHSGSSGQCMASIRVERDGQPGETCACTAYVPPPSARASAPEETAPKASEPEAAPVPTADDLPPATGEVVESLPDGWLATERATGWWLSHVDVETPVGPFFPMVDAGHNVYVEQPSARPDLDAWMSGHEHILTALERELAKGAASFARHYPLGDDVPGWLLAVAGPDDSLALFLVRGLKTSPPLAWRRLAGLLEPVAGVMSDHDSADVLAASAWVEAEADVVLAAEQVIKRGDVRELPQPTDGVVLQ